jgi:predicted transcriptional regulator
MSRRRGFEDPTELDRIYAEHGLMRPGQVARALGVSADAVLDYIKKGLMSSERFPDPRGHGYWKGTPVEEVKALQAKLRAAAS